MLGVNLSIENVTHIGTLLKREIDGEEVNIQEAIKSIYADNMLDLLPSDVDLAFHHYWLDKVPLVNNAFELFMKRHTEFFSTYEVIVIDTTSSSSKLTRSLLSAAKSEIVSPLKLNGQYKKSLDELSNLLADINEQRDEAESIITPLIVVNEFTPSSKSQLKLREVTKGFEEFFYQYPISASSDLAIYNNQKDQHTPLLPGVERFPASLSAKQIINLAKHLIDRFELKINGFPNSYSLNI